MLRFFRTLRRKLLEEDKIRTYFWYAIGEILLVMIGILLALQVNNWNESRKTREIELSYLQSLQSDLHADLEDLELLKIDKQSKVVAALEMMAMNPPTNNAELMYYEFKLYTILSWVTFKPNNNTFTELVSSGNLKIISNASIKSGILELDQINKEIEGIRAHMRREYEVYLYDPIVTQTDHILFFDFEGFRNGHGFPIDTTKVYSGFELEKYNLQSAKMLENQTIRNGLKLSIMNNSYILRSAEIMEQKINEILMLIDNELEKG